MARGNKKKKSAKVGGTGGRGKRVYLNIKATFKCSNDKCGKSWTSAHAWNKDDEIFCELCDGGKAIIVNFLDEQCELDNYNCSCGSFWQSLHGAGKEECYDCKEGLMVSPSGTQKRFGRHFFIACTNCEANWEDFTADPNFCRTQRCSTCKSRGDIISTKKVKPTPFWLLKHDAECCDMCQDLKNHGRRSCLSLEKVYTETKLENEKTVEKIVGVCERESQ